MAIKKSELYSSLWKSCDELRGGMDASQYKDYVLVLLFVKYVSDKYSGQRDALIEVPVGGGFSDMVALKGTKDIGEGMNTIISKLAEANDLKGVIDVSDFNNEDKLGKGKEMQDRLSKLVGIFENESLDFSRNRADGDDILGDAYEYLMRHFATESGKSKGQFYTPAEVSRIMAKVIGINQAKSQEQTINDMACGSGSLLLKAADESETGVTIYGQEMDNATAALAKMNMILHGNPTAEIWKDNTLSSPHFKDEYGQLKTFDFAVANPPFSTKAWSNGFDPQNDLYDRFKGYGIPPDKNGDYAFLLHMIRSLKSHGKGAIILPHGVLFRGGAEGVIRRNIIRRGYIKGIIGLPANLFYGTGIPACIIVLDKENADARKGIFMIDAGKGYIKDGNKNRLREQDIHKIVDVFNRQQEMPKYARMVSVEEIEKNEYNLNIPRYIDSQEEEDIQDIAAHLLGGIPDHDINILESYWKVYPSLKEVLFSQSERPGYSVLTIEKDRIKSAIFSHPEFIAYTQQIESVFTAWKEKYIPILTGLSNGFNPKKLIHDLAEDILQAFSDRNLIDKYDVYQHLMSYWNETMQDDIYFITADGWKAELSQVKGKKDEWDCDLLPKKLLIQHYFSEELRNIETLEADKELIISRKEEIEEEHGGEDGFLEPYKNDKGKISKPDVQKRLVALTKSFAGNLFEDKIQDDNAGDELQILSEYIKHSENELVLGYKIKDARAALEKMASSKYRVFAEEEIKEMVVMEKWMTAIEQDVKDELQRISQRLTQRVKELAERYETPLPAQLDEVKALEEKVNAHLAKMGFVWR
ncbi:MAG: type I restriction-modification system subunit M [Bacteroidetes bacterium]|nr:type I restriction-modification system subunit M [Bacteroidota bacterium]